MSSQLQFRDIVKSLGLVFGDIGTSPLYTLSAIFMALQTSVPNILGALSLIIWTLTLLVTVQYAWLAMSLGEEQGEGEGGTIILRGILVPLLKSKRMISLVTFFSFVGIAFFIGDGVITPAISILSAVEGLKLIPFLHGLTQTTVIIVALVITILLFSIQKRGTERVSAAFGPIMLVWFAFISFAGLWFIVKHPMVLQAFNPYHAINFLLTHKIIGIIVLSKVILCATGSEALFADMGHLGRKPIVGAWSIVFVALCLIYLGQGAFLLENASGHDIFYEMILHQFQPLYVPVLLLSIMASVIASQAMISGLFSIVYQGMAADIMPRLHVEYTSRKLMTQIYIPAVNTFLLACVLFSILNFQYSHNLTNAYGLAASGTMTITAIFLTTVYFLKRHIFKGLVSVFLIFVNILFLIANLYKIPTGGYWSLIIASLPLTLILVYWFGKRDLRKLLKQMTLDDFVEKYSIVSGRLPYINGTAVYFTDNIKKMPTYLVQTMFVNNIIYEENVIVTLSTQRVPFGVKAMFTDDLAPGLRVFEICLGYMEIMNIEKILIAANIHPKVIFYGLEDIKTNNPIWKIFVFIKRLTPTFVQFYKLPTNKLHGVLVHVEM